MATTIAAPAGAAPGLNWEIIKNEKAPYGDVPSNQFGYWFNYFWAEASHVTNLTQQQKDKLTAAFSTAFESGPGARRVKPAFEMQSPAVKKEVLKDLLLIGFKQVLLDPPPVVPILPGAPAPPPAPLTAKDAIDLNLTKVLVNGAHWPIAYRSDSRSYDELKNQGGFTPRARSQGSPIYAAYGLDQAWHPFNDPAFANSLWLRIGETSKDNCLHTVISVGPSFPGITHFPILNDATVFQAKSADGRFLCFKPFDEWTDQDIQAAASDRQKVRAVKNAAGAVEYLVKQNHIHVFHLCGIKGYNTQEHFAGKDDFGERGIEKVPVSHLLADLAFTQRYWFSDTGRQIMLYKIAFDPIRWVPSEDAVNALLGDDGRLIVNTLIARQIDEAQRRPDVTVEEVQFNAYLVHAATRLTQRERQQVVTKLREYFLALRPAPGAPPAAAPAAVAAPPAAAGVVAPLAGGPPPPPPVKGAPPAPGPAPNLAKPAAGKSIAQQNAERQAAILAERNAVKLQYPALTAKIDALDAAAWAQIQVDARR